MPSIDGVSFRPSERSEREPESTKRWRHFCPRRAQLHDLCLLGPRFRGDDTHRCHAALLRLLEPRNEPQRVVALDRVEVVAAERGGETLRVLERGAIWIILAEPDLPHRSPLPHPTPPHP